MSPQDIPQRKHWYQPHFDVLTHFGVWSSGCNSTIFKVSNSPSVGNQTVCALKGTRPSKDLPRVSTLLHDIRAAVPDDAFLGDVLQAVLLTQMTISIGSFSSMTTTSFVFVEVKMWYPESVYLFNLRERFCERLTVTVSWRVTRELIVQQLPSHILFAGLDYMLTWHTLSVLVPLVQRRRVAIING